MNLLQKENSLFREENIFLREENSQMKYCIALLEEKLLCYAHLKDSVNNSIPASQEPFCGKLHSFQNIPFDRMCELHLDGLLHQTLYPKYEKLITFKNRFTQYRQYMFRYLNQYDVPPGNNASGRAVRTFNVKENVSGLFRSSNGAMALAVIRSMIDTAIKNSRNCRCYFDLCRYGS